MRIEKECVVCGTVFLSEHGNKRMCPECTTAIQQGKGRKLPKRYACPEDIEQYEEKVRRRNIAEYKDTIVAIGYADRQRAETLNMVGKVRTEL